MSEEILIGLTAIVALGVGSQWLAWRLRLPPILLLLIVGFIAEPVTGLYRAERFIRGRFIAAGINFRCHYSV